MHGSARTSTTTPAWGLYNADSPHALYRLLIEEAITQKFGDNAIPNEEMYYIHLDILDFAIDAALALLGVGTSWQPVIQAIMQGQPIAVDIAPLLRACSPADSMALHIE